ncbi:MAG: tetratricopeptide repeat protein [Alphaproteobacteria bacterium]|nr:tetratricopeptide repeat protein [Alphaproteobacteria bacterium]
MRKLKLFMCIAAALAAAPTAMAASSEFATAFTAFNSGHYLKAFRQFKTLAERGDAYSQYNVAVFYSDDAFGVRRNYAESVKWYRRAARQEHPEAQFRLAVMYIYGYGVPKDRATARYWLRRAAAQGHLDAQYNLGFIYRSGRDVARNDAEAAKWYRLAAEQGSREAQAVLGVMYARGEGVGRDQSEAERWLGRAAAQGHGQARKDLDFLRDGGLDRLTARADEFGQEFWREFE